MTDLPTRAAALRAEIEPLLAGATPLPWKGGVLVHDKDGIGRQIVERIASERGQAVGAIMSDDHRLIALLATTDATVPEDKANAALTCAAVNLFPEALSIIAEQAARIAELEEGK